jgi:type II secretory pathway component PulF
MELNLESVTLYTDKVKNIFKHFQFGNSKQLAFLEDLYTLINDGIPANRAIEMMAEVSTGVSRDVALSLSQKIAEGQPLAEGMRDWFSMNVVEIVRVGESGGALGQTIQSAVNMLARQGSAVGALIAAVLYPLVVITIACGLIIYLNTSVFVQFKMIKPISEWPDAGKRLVMLAGLITYWWWIIIVGVIAIFVIFGQVMKKYTGELRPILDRYPPFSFYRKLLAARVLETMGLLVANGVVFKSAISVMQMQANPYMLSHLSKMEYLLSMGKTNIAEVLDTGLINDSDLTRLRVMAEVKGFEHGLIRMGIKGAEDVATTLKTIAKMFGGLLLVVGGILIIMIVQGIYLTGMSMAS